MFNLRASILLLESLLVVTLKMKMEMTNARNTRIIYKNWNFLASDIYYGFFFTGKQILFEHSAGILLINVEFKDERTANFL